ncbi:MAG TPA: FISUMP domain-containing protein [Bryobacteraceae bacterium]|nr:FISUMP domain-containing protein [Bryobacteraceae bacterium]
MRIPRGYATASRRWMLLVAMSLAAGCTATSVTPAQPPDRSSAAWPYAFKPMADGKRWITTNLNIKTEDSYCYADVHRNCQQYGRLYTWASAQRACQSLGNEWRLPTDGEWRELAKRHGGVSEDAADKGKTAYRALLIGGESGFNAVLGGGREPGGDYARGDAHGFYWTATEDGGGHAWFYNFGKGGLAVHRQAKGEKERAFSVRCVSP